MISASRELTSVVSIFDSLLQDKYERICKIDEVSQEDWEEIGQIMDCRCLIVERIRELQQEEKKKVIWSVEDWDAIIIGYDKAEGGKDHTGFYLVRGDV